MIRRGPTYTFWVELQDNKTQLANTVSMGLANSGR